MSSFGQPVCIKYIPLLACNIACRRSGKPVKPPGKNWARAFEKRHPELTARRVRSIDWKRHEIHIYDKVTDWFNVISKVINDPNIRPENVYNMDETGVMLSMLGSVKVLVGKDDLRGHRGAGVKRTQVTAIECISADGRSLLPLIIWPAKSHRSNWITCLTPGWHYAFSENGYNDSKISLEWLKLVFDPQTKERADGKPRVLICDGFGSYETLEILEFCFENNIILCRLPSHTSYKL
ncbi:transposase [Stagonosporopsis vannaccii]|nr:transposase [Stagonosporopsis vannaccii]